MVKESTYPMRFANLDTAAARWGLSITGRRSTYHFYNEMLPEDLVGFSAELQKGENDEGSK